MWQLTLLSHDQECAKIEELLDDEHLISLSMLNAGEDFILEQHLHEKPQWSSVKIEALFAQEEDALSAMQRIEVAKLGHQYECKPLPERNWVIYGLKDFKPLNISGHLWIYPYWLLPEEPQTPFVSLDPGFAFGTGEHPTTKMCLEWLTRQDLSQKTIVDYGCGSGILGLAALKLGASQAYGLDIDPQACESSEQNAHLNHIDAQQFLVYENQADLPPQTDILIANIVMNPLLELRDYFHQILSHDGYLVLSGLLKTQCSQILDRYQTHFQVIEQNYEQDWACLVFRHKS
jgi:ribosomal protein L11 methyltransferase